MVENKILQAVREAGMEVKITDASEAVFLAYAKDASNWSGTPLLGEGGTADVAEYAKIRGNLTQLKRAGLIATWDEKEPGSPKCTWLRFTDAGVAYAASLGIEISR